MTAAEIASSRSVNPPWFRFHRLEPCREDDAADTGHWTDES